MPDRFAAAVRVAVPEVPPNDDESAAMANATSRVARDASAAGDTSPGLVGGDAHASATAPIINQTPRQVGWPLSWGAVAVVIAAAWWWTSRQAVKKRA
jgi:hypothetical protein